MPMEVSLMESASCLDAAGLAEAARDAWRYEARRLEGCLDASINERNEVCRQWRLQEAAIERLQEEVLAMEHMLERERLMHEATFAGMRQAWESANKASVARNQAIDDKEFWKEEAEKNEKELAFREADAKRLGYLGDAIKAIGAPTLFRIMAEARCEKPGAHLINALMVATGLPAGVFMAARNDQTW